MKTVNDIPEWLRECVIRDEGRWTGGKAGAMEFRQATRLISGEPDDKNAPKWANWKAQDPTGEWWWYESKPIIEDQMFKEPSGIGRIRPESRGTVLGDWRDTLKPVNRESETVTPEEDEEWQRKLAEQKAHRNNWHERGELPPVGEVCEFADHCEWRRCEIVAHTKKGVVIEWGDTGFLVPADPYDFRPIDAKREIWVDEAIRATDYKAAREDVGNIYDAMFDGTLPAPGGDA